MASRSTYRKNDYHKLTLSHLKSILDAPAGATLKFNIREQSFTILPEGETISITSSYGALSELSIKKVWTGKGWRSIWGCGNPSCERNCYYLNLLYGQWVCRHCANLRYDSQNGYERDYVADKIRELRKRLWKDECDSYLYDNVLESCEYVPKPKGMSTKRFEREKARILVLEKRFNSLVPARYWPFINVFC